MKDTKTFTNNMESNMSFIEGKVTKTDVSNIKYDLDGILGFENYDYDGIGKKDILEELPTEVVVELGHFETDYDNPDHQIQKYIESFTGWLTIGFEYELNGATHKYEEPPLAEQMILLGGGKRFEEYKEFYRKLI